MKNLIRSISYRLLPGIIPAVLLLAAPATATAQSSGAEAALDEITVTARRREESLQDVPVAVTAISGEKLVDLGAADISELQGLAPNLSIYPGRNQSTTLTAFVRGIGQADPLWGVDPGVGLYIDDVYLARPQGALLDVFDVERVEILRGPQGTLYGKNTIGGAIKFVSKPLSDDFESTVRITAGEHDTQEVTARIGGALIEGQLRGKLAIASLQRGGYGKNLFTGTDVSDKDTLAFRGALEWIASDNLSFKLSADLTEDDSQPKGYNRLEPNPLCPVFLGVPCNSLDNPHDVESGLVPTNGTETNGTSLTIDWGINDAWSFKSITAFRESDTNNNIDFDTTPAPIVDVFAAYYDDQLTQEFQLVYDAGGKFAGVMGAFYLDGEAGGLVRNIFVGSIFGTTNGRTETTSIGLYADGSYAMSDRLNLNFGLRVTEEEKRGVAFNAGYTDATFSVISLVTANYDNKETFNSVSPRLGLDFSVSDDVMLYGHVSRGFKSGGFNVRAQSVFVPESALPFQDEELTNVEVGIKSTLADDQLVLNVAGFYGDYTDVQVSTFTEINTPQGPQFFGNFLNAGDAEVNGIEVEFIYSPADADWLTLSGNVNYLDAKPTRFLDANENGLVDTQVITNAPDNTGALNAAFNFPAGNGAVIGSVGVSYRNDSMLTNEGEGVEPLMQDSFSLWNASVGYTWGDGDYSLMLHGKNLSDEYYITNGYNIPVVGIKTGAAGTPRTVLLSFEANFD